MLGVQFEDRVADDHVYDLSRFVSVSARRCLASIEIPELLPYPQSSQFRPDVPVKQALPPDCRVNGLDTRPHRRFDEVVQKQEATSFKDFPRLRVEQVRRDAFASTDEQGAAFPPTQSRAAVGSTSGFPSPWLGICGSPRPLSGLQEPIPDELDSSLQSRSGVTGVSGC